MILITRRVETALQAPARFSRALGMVPSSMIHVLNWQTLSARRVRNSGRFRFPRLWQPSDPRQEVVQKHHDCNRWTSWLPSTWNKPLQNSMSYLNRMAESLLRKRPRLSLRFQFPILFRSVRASMSLVLFIFRLSNLGPMWIMLHLLCLSSISKSQFLATGILVLTLHMFAHVSGQKMRSLYAITKPPIHQQTPLIPSKESWWRQHLQERHIALVGYSQFYPRWSSFGHYFYCFLFILRVRQLCFIRLNLAKLVWQDQYTYITLHKASVGVATLQKKSALGIPSLQTVKARIIAIITKNIYAS